MGHGLGRIVLAPSSFVSCFGDRGSRPSYNIDINIDPCPLRLSITYTVYTLEAALAIETTVSLCTIIIRNHQTAQDRPSDVIENVAPQERKER